MDWQIRIALIIVGILIIGFILFDYARKKKKQDERERLIEQMRASADCVDESGFDCNGVGSVRSSTQILEESARRQPGDNRVNKKKVFHGDERQPAGAAVQERKSKESSQKEKAPSKLTTTDEVVESVLSLILRSEDGATYKGEQFVPLLLAEGLHYGEMGIFHRYAGASRRPGPVLFSVANGINPGTFDIDTIKRFETPAIVFFMTIPFSGDAVAAYKGMVRTAMLFKKELGGQLLDGEKQIYTEDARRKQIESLKGAQLVHPRFIS